MPENPTFIGNRERLKELSARMDGEVRLDRLTRALYSTDASSYQIEPLGACFPAHVADVQAVVRFISEKGLSIVPRGGGSSLSGQGIGEGLIMDLTPHLNRILEINPAEKWARVEAGVTLDQLNRALAPHGLMVGPDPSSAVVATIGGMTANNSTGSHSILYGMMADHLRELEVVLSDGTTALLRPQLPEAVSALAARDTLEGRLYRDIPRLLARYAAAIERDYPRTWRNVAGYNLNRLHAAQQAGEPFSLVPLIAGSEGTLAAITAVTVGLVPRPAHTHLTLLHFPGLREALNCVPQLLAHQPGAVELLDKFFIDLTRENRQYRQRLSFLKGDPGAVLIVEFAGSDPAPLRAQADAMQEDVRRTGFSGTAVTCEDPAEVANVWEVRKAGLGLLMSKRGDAKPLAFVDDAAVPVENLPDYAEQVVRICREAGTEAAFYAHASAGCLHINPLINLKTDLGMQQLQSISEAVIALAIEYGGTSTGEHGEGLARSLYNERVYGAELHRAFREVKGLFDPDNRFNPGKIVDAPLPWDPRFLRFQPGYQTPQNIGETRLDFSADGGFAGLVEMCNGQGICRKTAGGVMCPSFMATRDETHSTRGRANALRAAITGQLGTHGLDDPSLYEALDLCLGCKACKHECPSLVDMAKLKYEYLARYQDRNGVPLRSRLFGHIAAVNRLGSLFPGLANRSFRSRAVRALLQRWFGIDRRRSLPPLAPQTFQHWFQRHPKPSRAPNGPVILWDDTFLSHNEPEIGRAAVRVLEAAGFEVLLAHGRRCCGRPLISRGMLDAAREHAAHNVALLLPLVRRGIAVVGMEPSCISAFRDEYIDLLRSAEAREVAEACCFFDAFLTRQIREKGISLPWKADLLPQTILTHGHCHQKAGGGTGSLVEMLRLIPGAAVREIDSGCCGMAGAFGYETAHYDVSLKCGEDRLFPAVRAAESDTRITAAGTSCRHQIADGTGRKAEHPVVVVARCLEDSITE